MPIDPATAAARSEDVAKQVRPHHDIEALRLQHKLGGQRVDVFAVEAHVRVQRGPLGHTSSQNGRVCTIPFDFVAEVT